MMKAKMWNVKWWGAEINAYKINCKYSKLLKKSGFNVLGEIEYHFNPQGYTKLWLLGESHFAVHTFPERKKTYFELSSCNKKYFDNFRKLTGN